MARQRKPYLRVGNFSQEYDQREVASLEQRVTTKFNECDESLIVGSGWQLFAPQLAAPFSGDAKIGNGQFSATYRQIGDSLDLRYIMVFGTTTSLGTDTLICLDLPVGFVHDISKSIAVPALGTLAYLMDASICINISPGNTIHAFLVKNMNPLRLLLPISSLGPAAGDNISFNVRGLPVRVT